MRYLRLYAYFLRFSFSRAMEFRLDFFFRIGMDALWYVVHLVFFTVLFRHTNVLGSWNFDQMLVFAATLFLVDSLQMTILSNNRWMFPILVNRGDLDYYLVRPVSPLFFVSLREFAANSFLNLLMAFGILVWALMRYPEPIGWGRIVVYAPLVACGVTLFYVFSMLAVIPVFWLHSRDGLRQVFWSLNRFGQRPDGIYKGWIRRILVTMIPMALTASYPVRVLFDQNPLHIALHVVAVTVVSFAVLLMVWRRGLRAYSSASS